jgi:hypothetical protein
MLGMQAPWQQPKINPIAANPRPAQAGVPQQTKDSPSQPHAQPNYAGTPQQTRDAPSQPYAQPNYSATPQQTRDAPSQPNPAPHAQPGYGQAPPMHAPAAMPASPDTTLRTRPNPGDSALDRPPRNMLPVYALLGITLITIIVLVLAFVL